MKIIVSVKAEDRKVDLVDIVAEMWSRLFIYATLWRFVFSEGKI